MRKLRGAPAGGGEKLGVLSFEVAALMSRAAGLWRALGDAPLARLREDSIRLEGVRRLVADDDAALLALALAETAGACAALARAVAPLAAARCADPLLRRFGALFAALVKSAADPHGLRYAAPRKMDRKARKMQRLVAATAHLGQELDVLAELEQALRRDAGGGECARRVARQRAEVDRLRAASLWARTFDYAVRLLARSLFTIAARIVEVFDLDHRGDDENGSSRISSRLSSSWSSSSFGAMVYPSDAPRPPMPRARSVKAVVADDARRLIMSRTRSLRQQLRWPAAGRHLVGCVAMGAPGNGKPHSSRADPPLSFSYVSSSAAPSSADEFSFSGSGSSSNVATRPSAASAFFDPSRRDAPASSLGGAALALHYAHLIMLVERLAASPRDIGPGDRDALYGMLTGAVRASLRARLRPRAAGTRDPALAAEWSDTVRRILAWLAPLAHNMVRWQAERNFEQRNVASSAGVLLLQTLHFADRRKTEAAITELLVGLDCMWRHANGMELLEPANARTKTDWGQSRD